MSNEMNNCENYSIQHQIIQQHLLEVPTSSKASKIFFKRCFILIPISSKFRIRSDWISPSGHARFITLLGGAYHVQTFTGSHYRARTSVWFEFPFANECKIHQWLEIFRSRIDLFGFWNAVLAVTNLYAGYTKSHIWDYDLPRSGEY